MTCLVSPLQYAVITTDFHLILKLSGPNIRQRDHHHHHHLQYHHHQQQQQQLLPPHNHLPNSLCLLRSPGWSGPVEGVDCVMYICDDVEMRGRLWVWWKLQYLHSPGCWHGTFYKMYKGRVKTTAYQEETFSTHIFFLLIFPKFLLILWYISLKLT